MIEFQSRKPELPFLLASDLDGTILGDKEGEQWIRSMVQSLGKGIIFAVITGRSIESIKDLVKENRIPQPDFMCASVGTVLIDCNDHENTIGKKFLDRVSRDWDLEAIIEIGQGPGIRCQDFPEGQPPHQAGFYWDGKKESLAAFFKRMTDLNIYQIQVSSDFYIDVLPKYVGKGNSVLFIQKELNLDWGRIMVAGDTGNDKKMFETGLKGVVPINALDELKLVASEPWHFHSDQPAGRGVIDGLRFFRFIE